MSKEIKLVNLDKTWDEPFNPAFPGTRGSAYLFVGTKNSGKSYWCNRMIDMMDFDRVIIVYSYAKSREYVDIPHEKLCSIDEICTSNFEDTTIKTLLVIEDLYMEGMPKCKKEIIHAILRQSCSHSGLTCILNVHSLWSLDTQIRDLADVMILFGNENTALIKRYADRCGLDKEDYMILAKKYLKPILDDNGKPVKYKPNIVIDRSGHPTRYRYNTLKPAIIN